MLPPSVVYTLHGAVPLVYKCSLILIAFFLITTFLNAAPSHNVSQPIIFPFHNCFYNASVFSCFPVHFCCSPYMHYIPVCVCMSHIHGHVSAC